MGKKHPSYLGGHAAPIFEPRWRGSPGSFHSALI